MNWEAISALGTWASVIVTCVALIYAAKALSTWREQEKVKAKMGFKKSLLNFRQSFIFMPDIFDMQLAAAGNSLILMGDAEGSEKYNLIEYARGLKNLVAAYENCNGCWVATEHLFDGKGESELFNELIDRFNGYLAGNTTKDEFVKLLINLYSRRFVFEHR
ncbi:TPA: hypothetical protein PXM11_001619 [Yersinia enterocolitica]|uniref:DUF4760 domain-containing protein n=1 Tax=Yersinia enterocolitica TaxID=630 RepID=A0ABP1Y878_YEREN|nr:MULTISPECIES: hypothetical protein [Yersinia]PJG60954.1 hypothetical protein CV016_20115 [Yersinia kristensenii]CNE17219.1 Uncharacterised protein [Yersinia enterocolitica]CNF77919.1 Uncharacterised protein [Yersinia enterocolitica]CQD70831.1 Uncharacterised protein [Yersinia enterocolitica]CRX90831.1 Uncharacterised protein [Yersinia enterocolitica]